MTDQEIVDLGREADLRQIIYFRKDDDGAPVWKDSYVYAILESDETDQLFRETVELTMIPVESTMTRFVSRM